MNAFKRMLPRLRGQSGQGMTEYIIIVALIAIGTIAVVTAFGDNVRALFGQSTSALAGESVTMQKADGAKGGHRNLTDFNKDVGK